MGFEVTYVVHPKKEEGFGYDTEKTEEIKRKVGNGFDDTPLQELANAIVAMMARRDVYVADVKIQEFVKKDITFKESADGRGIILKGKKFSLDGTSVPEPVPVAPTVTSHPSHLQPHEVASMQPHQVAAQNGNGHAQPHEMIPRSQPAASQSQMDNLYNRPNVSLAPKRNYDMSKVNRNRVLYWVYFEPYMWRSQTRNLSFTEDKKYPVHDVVPSVTGRLDQQQIVVTDDKGNLSMIDEKFFTSAGGGLVGDNEANFSGDRGRRGARKPKLMYEDEMVIDAPASNLPSHLQSIPVDDGSVPVELLNMPNLRPGQSPM